MKNAIYFFLSALTVVVVLSPIFYKSSNGIETYHEDDKYVTASAAVKPKINAPFMNSMPATANTGDSSIIGSMIEHQGSAWFLKIKGSTEKVKQQVNTLKSIHQTLSFAANGDLKITAPSSWESKAASGMRFASYSADGLDISIIRLPAGQDLQGNIVRWKKQIGLTTTNTSESELNTVQRDGFKIHEIFLFSKVDEHAGHNHSENDGHDHSSKAPMAPMAKIAAGSNAIFAAIFEREDATWFLKLTGPIEEVQQQSDNLIAIIGEHSFSPEGNLTFTNPKDWQTAQGSSMRYASYKSGNVDISVSKLGPKQDLDANVNRWKRQIGIASSSSSPNERRTFFVKGINVHIVNLKAVQAATNAHPTQNTASAPVTQNTADLEEFDLPMDKPWTEISAAKGISMGKYSLTLGADQYTLSITRMNQLIPMQSIYDMWLSQMNLATGTVPATQKLACKSGHDFELIRLENESESLAAATYQGKSMLFVKLNGPASQKDLAFEHFKSLIKSMSVK